jgi:hypothetical protein
MPGVLTAQFPGSTGICRFIIPAGMRMIATIDAGTIASAGGTRRPALNQIQRG